MRKTNCANCKRNKQKKGKQLLRQKLWGFWGTWTVLKVSNKLFVWILNLVWILKFRNICRVSYNFFKILMLWNLKNPLKLYNLFNSQLKMYDFFKNWSFFIAQQFIFPSPPQMPKFLTRLVPPNRVIHIPQLFSCSTTAQSTIEVLLLFFCCCFSYWKLIADRNFFNFFNKIFFTPTSRIFFDCFHTKQRITRKFHNCNISTQQRL